jgi:hypothetical protein
MAFHPVAVVGKHTKLGKKQLYTKCEKINKTLKNTEYAK